ncbi:MAG TPA: hypothetical protein VFA94_03480 [Acidimicrobiales bacterium]|nr:hypothetical protein [Acidimicrobiales bacterium]
MSQLDGDSPEHGPDLSWPRAIGSGLAILVVGFVAAVYGANAVLTKLTGFSRSTRQYLAATLFFAVVILVAWGLRRLQSRQVI